MDKIAVGLEQDPESSETKPGDLLLCFSVGLASASLGHTHTYLCADYPVFGTSASLSYNEHGYLYVYRRV